jgi:hypothetical protein
MHGVRAIITCLGVHLALVCCGIAQEILPVERTSEPAHANASIVASCPNADVIVFGASPQEQALICSGAVRAMHQLGRCGIVQRRSIRIRIVETVRIPLGVAAVASYDPRLDEIAITRLATAASLVQRTPYAVIPFLDLYESFAVHELVHSMMHAHVTAVNAAAHEYAAYALQMELWPAHARTRFIAAAQAELSPNEARSFFFTEDLLFSNPYFFAARVFLHYSNSGDRCWTLSQLSNAPFIPEIPPYRGAR